MAAYRESFVFRIGTDLPALFWSGHGNLPLAADTVLPAPVVVPGAGELVDIPDLEQLINGTAQRLEVTLSGVSEAAIVLANEEADQVPGARVDIGRVTFDDDWIVVSVEWEWSGEGKSLAISSDTTEQGRTRSLKLVVGAGETTRGRAPLAFFTAAEQQRDFPTDQFFSHVAKINGGTSRRWGPR
ncbi:MAG: hypothetical protein V4696_06255 [Pseudomonadota bacterium]